jgi:prevent-host-death family protein
MPEIEAFAAEDTLRSLLDRVERGEEILITRYGRPVARLVPHSDAVVHSEARAAIRRIRERAKSLSAGKFNWTAMKADRDRF